MRAGLRESVCVAAGGGADGYLGGCHRGPNCAGVRVCDYGSLTRTRSDALILEERSVWGTQSPLRVLFDAGVMSHPATPRIGERVKWRGGGGGREGCGDLGKLE